NIEFFRASRMDEYLRIMSIYQTCQYKEVSFLKFLLSKEIDIFPFAVQKVQKLNFQGGLSFGPTCTLRPGRSVPMLSVQQLQLGRGGCQASATGATGPGDPRAKRPGDYYRAS